MELEREEREASTLSKYWQTAGPSREGRETIDSNSIAIKQFLDQCKEGGALWSNT